MITETATVIHSQGKLAEVEIQRQSVCGHCELESGCGTGAIGRLLGNRRRPLMVETDQPLQPGDQVVLAMPESMVVKASILIYGLPLVGMLIFGLTAHTLVELEEWLIVAAAATGFWAGFKCAVWMGQRMARSSFSLDIIDVRVNPEQLSES